MKDILTKVDRNDGMTVPDGYFDDFAAKMMASLPEKEWESPASKVMPRSFWQKVRPYVYLAAMFMGVWCMMKMFDLMRSDSYGLQIENNPVMTAAIGNDHFINDYSSMNVMSTTISSWKTSTRPVLTRKRPTWEWW